MLSGQIYYYISSENALLMDTDDVSIAIDDHIEDESFIHDFDCPNTIYSDREKFITPLAQTKNIDTDILSNHGTQTFNIYVEELKLMKRMQEKWNIFF